MMKRTFGVFVVAFASIATLSAATVGKVICRQQWPWNSDVKVEYLLSGVSGPVDIKVQCYNGEEELDSGVMHNAISGEVFNVRSSGVKTFTIDPVKAFGAGNLEMKDFNVRLTAVPATADYDEVLYKVFSLVEPYTCTDITRGELLNGKYGDYETDFGRIGEGFNTTLSDVLIWTAVTNGIEYKTDKLVMRKIPAKDIVWKIGANPDEFGLGYEGENGREAQHTVKLTEDYYIGVFEMTQTQFTHIYGSDFSSNTGHSDSGVRPAEKVTYDNLRGWGDLAGMRTGEKVMWPTNSYRHDVFNNRLLGKMRTRFNVMFDLPTEAQWEFACRAGTTNALNSGFELTSIDSKVPCPRAEMLAWMDNSDFSSQEGATAQSMPVGLKKPNAFGLYDMHGNVGEWCLDVYSADIDVDGTGDPLVDPVGPVPVLPEPSNAKTIRTVRGGSYNRSQRLNRSATRISYWHHGHSHPYIGFRVTCPAAADWK